MSDVTRILSEIESGDPHAAEQLLPLVYDELRKLAAAKLAREKPGQTLQATALVHDAYLRLVDAEKAQHWNSRNHFFRAAAESMRRILVETARRKASQKRGGRLARQEFDSSALAETSRPKEVIAVHDALQAAQQLSARRQPLNRNRFSQMKSIDLEAAVFRIAVNEQSVVSLAHASPCLTSNSLGLAWELQIPWQHDRRRNPIRRLPKPHGHRTKRRPILIGRLIRGGCAEVLAAGKNLAARRTMHVHVVGHRPQQTNLVQMLRQLWQMLTNLDTGSFGCDGPEFAANFGRSLRLHIPQINLARSTEQEKENA
jgi:RNA polymerase sigma factor (TIGR02999 family)